jgi:cytochrome b subunit of formate dehydrogenase
MRLGEFLGIHIRVSARKQLQPSPTARFGILLIFGALARAGVLASPASQIQSSDCLACHNDPTLTISVHGKRVSLYIPEKVFLQSVHGILNCTDCHTDIKSIPHQAGLMKPSCGSCHGEEQTAYVRSVHGEALQRGESAAARCIDCHGEAHSILDSTEPTSMVYHAKVPSTCGSCHRQKFVMSASGLSTQVFFSYEQSVHGRAVSAGSQKAAVCTDCHGTHAILMAGDPKSSTFKFNVPATCGKCHETQDNEFMQSVHGRAIARGNWLAPVCTDCHGIHTILTPGAPGSSVSGPALAQVTCARCHQDVRLTSEFGVPGWRITSYLSSYHGMASRLGSTVVANCASCHGSHLILASIDPRSTINKANLAATCGKCHSGASTRFTRFSIHAGTSLTDVGTKVVDWVRRFYLGIIVVVIGGMVFHNIVVWRSKAAARRKLEHRVVIRMTLNQRIQHWLLLGCFAVLVFTGFALLYPFSTFADLIGLTDPIRRTIHRTAGVALIATGIYHVFYVARKGDGRGIMRALLPQAQDVRDAWITLRYNLGLDQEKAAFGRFSYGEKFEYWAVLWGTIIMASTGLMAWLEIVVTRFLPGWLIDVVLTIHLYEAILATLAMLVWHFYEVILDPDVYPMNWAWWDGRMSLEHYQEEHPLDTETIFQAVKKERDVAAGEQKSAADHHEPKSENEEPSQDHAGG